MPTFLSAHFGEIEYAPGSPIEFPEGLPAFESERRFLLIEQSASAPILFLQSLSTAGLVFLTVPATQIVPDYALSIEDNNLSLLGGEDGTDKHLDVLSILTVHPDGHVTANLMAPVVINPATRRGCQLIQLDCPYSHQHPLELPTRSENPSC